MGITFEMRLSDSPFVERVWRSRSEDIDSFISVAVFQWDFVVWTQQGVTQASIQGPETRANRAPVPNDAEFFGIIFRPGIYLPHLPIDKMVNSNIALPSATSRSFWLKGASWQFPTYENAETFVNQLFRKDLIAYEPMVESMLQGCMPDMSLRSVQRRFLNSVGVNYRTIQQIERARRSAMMLREGVSILDTIYEMGYFDQAHLTKSLKYYIGQTPVQLISQSEELSLLYKTSSFC